MTVLADEGDQTEYEIIPISTAQDLLDLADQCHEDSWSVNKIAELQNDINLTGFSFTSIPIWNGIFRGNGGLGDDRCLPQRGEQHGHGESRQRRS